MESHSTEINDLREVGDYFVAKSSHIAINRYHWDALHNGRFLTEPLRTILKTIHLRPHRHGLKVEGHTSNKFHKEKLAFIAFGLFHLSRPANCILKT